MKEGINIEQITTPSVTLETTDIIKKRADAIKKGEIAGAQQAYRGRPISKTLEKKAIENFGIFAKDYCQAYEAKYKGNKKETPAPEAVEKIYRIAKHLARRRFENRKKSIPNLEKISKYAEKYGEHKVFFTLCLANHFNTLLVKKGEQPLDSLIMPPLKRHTSNTASQVITNEQGLPFANTDNKTELANVLLNSLDMLAVGLLSEMKSLKVQFGFVPDMVIEVPAIATVASPVIFSTSTNLTPEYTTDQANGNSPRKSNLLDISAVC
ncbi:MAG: hypothetical protein HYX61_09970 [Gammaproteobacteria bacterium]|nr:hypothetical protein [Gammaproteobacteria bacterium]